MKIMVVGGGGREHAIIKKIKENPQVTELYALPGNGGIAKDATCVDIAAKDVEGVVAFAKEKGIDFAVVAPDDPLVLGMVDALNAIGIPCFGPDKKAAILEGSKVFSKNLMKKYGIPTAAYEVFDDMEKALAYLEAAPLPTVVKADGLALGKGVIIAETKEQAQDAVRSMMADTSPPSFLMRGMSLLAAFCSAFNASARALTSRRSASIASRRSICASISLLRLRIACFTNSGFSRITLMSNMV